MRMDNEDKIFAIILIFCFISGVFIYVDNLKKNQISDASAILKRDVSSDLALSLDTVFATDNGIWVAWATEDSERVQFVQISQIDGKWAIIHVVNFVKPVPHLPAYKIQFLGMKEEVVD